MLFDLRGRGRRRTIQTIYLFLAILLGGGLVFFGIGGGAGSGGLLNAVGQNGSSSSTSDIFNGNVKAAEKKVATRPRDPAAWAALAHARYQVAGNPGANFDQSTGTFTSAGKAVLVQVKAAWDHYLSLKPKTPSADTAKEMVQVLGPGGLKALPAAVAAEEIVVAQNSTSASEYVRLALLAYLAGQTRKGDLASAQAISLAPKDQQAALKQQLASEKPLAIAQGNGTSTTTTPAQLPSG